MKNIYTNNEYALDAILLQLEKKDLLSSITKMGTKLNEINSSFNKAQDLQKEIKQLDKKIKINKACKIIFTTLKDAEKITTTSLGMAIPLIACGTAGLALGSIPTIGGCAIPGLLAGLSLGAAIGQVALPVLTESAIGKWLPNKIQKKCDGLESEIQKNQSKKNKLERLLENKTTIINPYTKTRNPISSEINKIKQTITATEIFLKDEHQQSGNLFWGAIASINKNVTETIAKEDELLAQLAPN